MCQLFVKAFRFDCVVADLPTEIMAQTIMLDGSRQYIPGMLFHEASKCIYFMFEILFIALMKIARYNSNNTLSKENQGLTSTNKHSDSSTLGFLLEQDTGWTLNSIENGLSSKFGLSMYKFVTLKQLAYALPMKT